MRRLILVLALALLVSCDVSSPGKRETFKITRAFQTGDEKETVIYFRGGGEIDSTTHTHIEVLETEEEYKILSYPTTDTSNIRAMTIEGFILHTLLIDKEFVPIGD